MRHIAAMILLAATASADEVSLKSGGKIEGLAKKDGDKVIVETLAGTTTIDASQVLHINTAHTSVIELYYEKAKAVEASVKPADFLELAIWCKAKGAHRFVRGAVDRVIVLVKNEKDPAVVRDLALRGRDQGIGAEMKPLWERLLLILPDDETARRELGYRRHQGQWLTDDEWQVAQGNVRFDGKWISKEEREQILRERDARLEERKKELDRREAKLAEGEKAMKEGLAKVEDELKKLKTKTAAVEEREKELKKLQDEFRDYLLCRSCGTYYAVTTAHICSKEWVHCSKCKGYFPINHKH